MQPFEQEKRDQGCPNLDAERILAGADKSFDPKILLERFEEQLDLPAVAVNRGYCGGGEPEMVGQQDDFALIVRVPDGDSPQQAGTIFLGLAGAEANEAVRNDSPGFRYHAFPGHVVNGIVLQSRDEIDLLRRPTGKQFVVGVAPVQRHNGAGVEREGTRHFDVAATSFGETTYSGI